jgi:hypothetical protein
MSNKVFSDISISADGYLAGPRQRTRPTTPPCSCSPTTHATRCRCRAAPPSRSSPTASTPPLTRHARPREIATSPSPAAPPRSTSTSPPASSTSSAPTSHRSPSAGANASSTASRRCTWSSWPSGPPRSPPTSATAYSTDALQLTVACAVAIGSGQRDRHGRSRFEQAARRRPIPVGPDAPEVHGLRRAWGTPNRNPSRPLAVLLGLRVCASSSLATRRRAGPFLGRCSRCSRCSHRGRRRSRRSRPTSASPRAGGSSRRPSWPRPELRRRGPRCARRM